MSIVFAQNKTKDVHTYSPFLPVQQVDCIRPEDLRGLGRIELYSVIAEHWLKCTTAAKIRLMCHQDEFIRVEAIAQGMAFSMPQICAVFNGV